jgi:16S rRNA processing protein RimM
MGIENAEEWNVLVGRVSGTWDRAYLKITPYSTNPDRFAAGNELRAGADKKLLRITRSKKMGHSLILDCELKTTPEAQAFVGLDLFIHPAMRPPLPNGGFYPDELLGLRLQTEDGDDWGEIEEVLETPAHDVYVSRRAMIPSVDEFIIKRDFENRVVIVRAMPGLLTDE